MRHGSTIPDSDILGPRPRNKTKKLYIVRLLLSINKNTYYL